MSMMYGRHAYLPLIKGSLPYRCIVFMPGFALDCFQSMDAAGAPVSPV